MNSFDIGVLGLKEPPYLREDLLVCDDCYRSSFELISYIDRTICVKCYNKELEIFVEQSA